MSGPDSRGESERGPLGEGAGSLNGAEPGLIVVGFGGVVQKVHAPLLRGGVGLTVVAVVEPHAPNADAARDAFPDAEVVSSLPAAYEAVPDAEAALIAAPPAKHADLTLEAAALGLHTYTEKPLAVEAHELAALRDLAGRAERFHAVGFNYRFHPNVAELRGLLGRGDLGTPRVAQTLFCSPAGKQQAAWKQQRRAGGGVVLDLLSHHLDLLTHLFGEPGAVSADTASIHTEEDTAAVRLRWPSGLIAQSGVALHASEVDRVTVVGDAGTFSHDRFHAGRTSLEPVRRRYGLASRARATRRMVRQSVARGREILRPRREPSHRLALRAFADAVRGRPAPTLATLADGLLNSELLLAADRSADAGGRWEPVAAPAEASPHAA